MQRRSDTAYLALAVLVILNDRVENKMLSGMNKSEKLDNILRAICDESSFNQYPSQHMLLMILMSLEGEFIKSGETFISFYCTELFDVVATCLGGSFMRSILRYSSSVFVKEKLQLCATQENKCSHTIRVQHDMTDIFFQRLTSDMNNNCILDVLSNKLFQKKEYRGKFVGCLQRHVKSKTLVDASTGSNVLHIVSSLGYSDFVRHFLKHDKCPDVNKKNLKGETPLHLACQNGHKPCVEFLMKCKPVIDSTASNKRTALHYACEVGDESIVKYLITNNASINNKDLTRMTPLHIACEKGHHAVVKCLVEQKADINEADKKGKTPLHYACKHGTCNIVEILILNKARVNKPDGQRSTPLHIACEYGNEKLVDLLIKHKANRNIQNKEGLRPVDIALQTRFDTIYNSLISVQDN